jgi:hypothetical protein
VISAEILGDLVVPTVELNSIKGRRTLFAYGFNQEGRTDEKSISNSCDGIDHGSVLGG